MEIVMLEVEKHLFLFSKNKKNEIFVRNFGKHKEKRKTYNYATEVPTVLF